MDLRTRLRTELDLRQHTNPRYSLRAFARSLGTHHSTLSRIIESRRRLTPRSIRSLCEALGLTPRQISDACLAENCALILRVVGDQRFRADSRWIAMMTGIPIDEVNVALHRLLYERRLTMNSRAAWTAGDR
jgi:transcriptional regulator with XRE-family HTH domain